MSVVTAEEVNKFLSSPPWREDQVQAVSRVCATREAELAAWLHLPISPVDRAETVLILPSGLVATTAPVWRLYEVDGIELTGDDPPEGWEIRNRYWLAQTRPVGGIPLPRPFSPLTGADRTAIAVSVRYAAGWGPHPALTGAILERVVAYAQNKHSDTVTATDLDGKPPPPLRERWNKDDFDALSAFRRPGAAG